MSANAARCSSLIPANAACSASLMHSYKAFCSGCSAAIAVAPSASPTLSSPCSGRNLGGLRGARLVSPSAGGCGTGRLSTGSARGHSSIPHTSPRLSMRCFHAACRPFRADSMAAREACIGVIALAASAAASAAFSALAACSLACSCSIVASPWTVIRRCSSRCMAACARAELMP